MTSISVFITCYAEGRLILDAYRSLEQQTDKDFDILIINDCSPDPETNEICRYLEKEKGVRVIRHKENGGLSAARNTGFSCMKGDVGVPLDGDDILPKNAVQLIRNGFNKRPDAGYLFGNYLLLDTETGKKKEFNCGYLAASDGSLNARQLVRYWRLIGTSPCTRAVWEKVGGYNIKYSNDLQDKDFWIRVLKAGCKGYYLNEVIYIWKRSPDGMNSSVPQRIQNKLVSDHIEFFETNWSLEQALNGLIRLRQYKKLKKYAVNSLKTGTFSLRLLFISLCPLPLLTLYYQAEVFGRLSSRFSRNRV